MEEILKYTLCHGSGNRFVMVDGVAQEGLLQRIDLGELARQVGYDGLLVVAREEGDYAMQMYNSDGTRAEMCGNGIRCVARWVREHYTEQGAFTLRSGGRCYPIACEDPIHGDLPTFGVEIEVRRSGSDFPRGGESFLAQPIAELASGVEFSYLNLGNPHIVARVQQIDYSLLEELGERIKRLPEWFPRGINLSFFTLEGQQRIFVATYERGVGLTESCGTAMTASATAATLLGLTQEGEEIEVMNRGGMVRCCCQITEQGIRTRLVGNASYESHGEILCQEGRFELSPKGEFQEEIKAYRAFLKALQERRA